MANHKDGCYVSMLLSAIESAVLYNNREKQIVLVELGSYWSNAEAGSDDERNAWKQIVDAAKWGTI